MSNLGPVTQMLKTYPPVMGLCAGWGVFGRCGEGWAATGGSPESLRFVLGRRGPVGLRLAAAWDGYGWSGVDMGRSWVGLGWIWVCMRTSQQQQHKHRHHDQHNHQRCPPPLFIRPPPCIGSSYRACVPLFFICTYAHSCLLLSETTSSHAENLG